MGVQAWVRRAEGRHDGRCALGNWNCKRARGGQRARRDMNEGEERMGLSAQLEGKVHQAGSGSGRRVRKQCAGGQGREKKTTKADDGASASQPASRQRARPAQSAQHHAFVETLPPSHPLSALLSSFFSASAHCHTPLGHTHPLPSAPPWAALSHVPSSQGRCLFLGPGCFHQLPLSPRAAASAAAGTDEPEQPTSQTSRTARSTNARTSRSSS